jgi:hypothetical protein
MPSVKHVKTFGEILPTHIIELVADGPSQLSFQLVLWNGNEAVVAPSMRTTPESGFGVTVFEPPDIDSTVLRAVRFPTHLATYPSSLELFIEVFNLIQVYTLLPEKPCRLLTYCVFASWFFDCTPISICVSIIGPESRQGWQVFRLLSCLFRRPLPLSDVSLSGLCSLPSGLCPTLFLEQRELSTQSEKFLHASGARDTFIPWRGRLVNLDWAKVIRSEEPLRKFTGGGSVIEIPVDPGVWSLPWFDVAMQREIADRFQAMLLMYRLNNIRQIENPLVDFPDFVQPVREVACCLTGCMPDMPYVESEMTSLLEERNLQVQSERETEPISIVIETMLSFCHQKKKFVRVAEVATAVNAISEQEGEMLELSPEAVGRKLKLLGLFTNRIDAQSRGLFLTEATRQLIHRLAWDHGVTKTRDLRCKDCKHFAKLHDERKTLKPIDFGKGLETSVQRQEEPAHPLVQPNVGDQPPVHQGEGIRPPRGNGTKDDQDVVDKFKNENEP